MKDTQPRVAELLKTPTPKLQGLLLKYNPLGGYSIGRKRGQMSRTQAIDTILRYEGSRK